MLCFVDSPAIRSSKLNGSIAFSESILDFKTSRVHSSSIIIIIHYILNLLCELYTSIISLDPSPYATVR